MKLVETCRKETSIFTCTPSNLLETTQQAQLLEGLWLRYCTGLVSVRDGTRSAQVKLEGKHPARFKGEAVRSRWGWLSAVVVIAQSASGQ